MLSECRSAPCVDTHAWFSGPVYLIPPISLPFLPGLDLGYRRHPHFETLDFPDVERHATRDLFSAGLGVGVEPMWGKDGVGEGERREGEEEARGGKKGKGGRKDEREMKGGEGDVRGG